MQKQELRLWLLLSATYDRQVILLTLFWSFTGLFWLYGIDLDYASVHYLKSHLPCNRTLISASNLTGTGPIRIFSGSAQTD